MTSYYYCQQYCNTFFLVGIALGIQLFNTFNVKISQYLKLYFPGGKTRCVASCSLKLLARLDRRWLAESDARPRYYYFRFLKTNGRHLEILLPVSILTFSLPSACDSALAYQIICKSDDRRRSYDVILILQDGDHSQCRINHVADVANATGLRPQGGLRKSRKFFSARQ